MILPEKPANKMECYPRKGAEKEKIQERSEIWQKLICPSKRIV